MYSTYVDDVFFAKHKSKVEAEKFANFLIEENSLFYSPEYSKCYFVTIESANGVSFIGHAHFPEEFLNSKRKV